MRCLSCPPLTGMSCTPHVSSQDQRELYVGGDSMRQPTEWTQPGWLLCATGEIQLAQRREDHNPGGCEPNTAKGTINRGRWKVPGWKTRRNFEKSAASGAGCPCPWGFMAGCREQAEPQEKPGAVFLWQQQDPRVGGGAHIIKQGNNILWWELSHRIEF